MSAKTSRGIHMGLGPSWIVLSLLNMAAAEYACGDRGAYRVCGDDLIGLFTRAERERYVAFLEGLGLKVNGSKSFYSYSGVFCEQLVVRTGPDTAESYDVGHLAEYGASKFVAGKSGDIYAAAEGLRKLILRPKRDVPKMLRRLALTRLRLIGSRLGKVSGPIAFGGNGGLSSDPRLLMFALTNSKISTHRRKKTPYGASLHNAAIPQSEMAPGVKHVTLNDAAVFLAEVHRTYLLTQGRHPSPPKPLKEKQYQRLARGHSTRVTPSVEQVRQASLTLNSKTKNFVRYVLGRNGIGELKRESASRIMGFLARQQNTLCVPAPALGKILLEMQLPHGFDKVTHFLAQVGDGSRSRQDQA
jgi:hypothetical protein